MTAPRRFSRGQVALKPIAIVAAFALLVACDDGPTAPAGKVAPTPVSVVQAVQVAGSWRGSYRDCFGFDGCGPSVEAVATFTQDGSRLTATVATNAQALREATFQGSLQQSRYPPAEIRGTLTLASGEARTVTGEASVFRIRLSVSSGPYSGGVLELTR